MSRPIRIPPRTPAQWVSDERTSICTGCHADFSMLRRKHHCRGCGRIFCHACSSQTIRVPTFVQHFLASTPTRVDESFHQPKRVCQSCYTQFHGARRSKTLVTVCASLPLTWPELLQLASVSTLWRDAIQTICLLWRSILVRLPGIPHSVLERRLLAAHLPDIAGHSRWAVRAYSMGLRPSLKRVHGCSTIGCDQTCTHNLSVMDILELYHSLPQEAPIAVESDLFSQWNDLSEEELRTLVPWFATYALRRPQIAAVMRGRIVTSTSLLWMWCNEMSLYSEQPYATRLRDMFLEAVDESVQLQWNRSRQLIEAVEQILDTEDEERRAEIVNDLFGVSGSSRISAPWDPTVYVFGIDLSGIRVLLSASKPTIIPLRTTSGVQRILYKREDVRRDQVTMTVAHWINTLTSLDIPTYPVLPITNSHGWIIMLDETTTLYEIRQQGKTLQNMLLDRLSHLTIAEFRTHFAKTCAAACVLCYVMGVGDRHLSNMLVTDDGRILHIDFTYILGDDPKHVRTEMRMTKDMLDALGGKDTASFMEFKDMCIDAYRSIRIHAPFWYALLTRVSDPERARRHVLQRLVPGQKQQEADDILVEIVDRSSSGSWGQAITDTSHAWSTWARSWLPAAPMMFKMDD